MIAHLPSATGAHPRAGTTSRTPETERAYLARALWFEAQAARHLGIDDPTPPEVAAYALERREEWAKSTWRQIKAALVYRYSEMGTAEAMIAVDALRDGSQSVCATYTERTSARREKAVKPSDVARVIAAVRAAGSRYAALLETWLLLGVEVGLRPHEWTQAELIWATPQELGDIDLPKTAGAGTRNAQPYLRVKNAKTTNGRSHGPTRHLNLSGLNRGLVEMVGEFAALMAQAKADGLYPSYYEGCKKLLQRINQRLHARNSAKWLQLYSPRHRFSSQAKNMLGIEGVAALMGHATTKTATQHYGRRSVSTGGTLGPRPVEGEVRRVRKMRNAAARRLEAGKHTVAESSEPQGS